MADDKTNVGKQDDIRVDRDDKSEVEYVHRQFPEKTHEEIVQAIEKYGKELHPFQIYGRHPLRSHRGTLL